MKKLVMLVVLFFSFLNIENLFAEEPKRDGSLLTLIEGSPKGRSGFSGTAWYISKSGEYEVCSIRNVINDNQVLLRKGTLSKEQLDDLVAYLAYRELNDMPTVFGNNTNNEINTHEFILRWSDGSTEEPLSKVLILKSGQSLENAEMELNRKKDSIHVDRFAAIIKTIQRLCID